MSKTFPFRILFIGRNGRAVTSLASLIAEGSSLYPEALNGESEKSLAPFEFSAVTNQKAALDEIRKRPPGIILLETAAKANSRVRFVEMIRYRLPTAAIVAVSRTAPQNSEQFDSYLPTPIDPRQALHLLHDIAGAANAHRLQRGPVLLNVATRTVVTPNGRYRMTPKQCALLQMLMLHHGQVVSRADIMQSIWQTSYLADTRTLYVHIRWLRECIEPDPSSPIYLVTVRGVGYCLNLEEARA